MDTLTTFDDGSGPALYIGGGLRWYNVYVSSPAMGLLKWDGQSLSVFQGGQSFDQGWFFVLDEGTGPRLYAEATIPGVGYWAGRWTGTTWVQPTPGLFLGTVGPVTTVYSAQGPIIYGWSSTGGAGVRFWRWNGTTWTQIGTTNFAAYGMIGYGPAGNQDLYVYGDFTSVSGVTAWGVARWNGTAWDFPGGDTHRMGGDSACVADLGQGPELYVGGAYAVGPPFGDFTAGVSRWNGQRWQDIGDAGPSINAQGLLSMVQFDDGSGPALYLGGAFSTINGVSVRNLAKWNGQVWSAVASTGLGAFVDHLAVFNDPRGPSLFAGGDFATVGAANGGAQSPALAQLVGCPGPAYVDCDLSGKRNVNDFQCFLNKYAARDPYADCDGNGYLNAADFMCFLVRFGQ